MAHKKQKQRKKGKPREPTTAPEPRPDDVNAYITFVLYAVTGHMARADGLMGRYGRGIRRVATWMRSRQPVGARTVYRGLLLDPNVLDGGKLTHEAERTFVSWTEDKDVACWFAAQDSIISELVVHMKPWVVSYLIASEIDPDRVLWHHSWRRVYLPGFGGVNLVGAATIHPEIDPGQFAWNMNTQKEVITEAPRPAETRLEPKRIEPGQCPETGALDARFAYPPYVASLGR